MYSQHQTVIYIIVTSRDLTLINEELDIFYSEYTCNF